MIASLRARVTSWYVGLLTVSLLVFGACIYLGVRRYLEASLQRSLASEARSIASTFVDEYEKKGNTWLAQELSESYPQSGNAQVVRVSRLVAGDAYQVLYPPVETSNGASEGLTLPPAVDQQAPEVRRETGSHDGPLVVYSLPYESRSGTRYLVEVAVSH